MINKETADGVPIYYVVGDTRGKTIIERHCVLILLPVSTALQGAHFVAGPSIILLIVVVIVVQF